MSFAAETFYFYSVAMIFVSLIVLEYGRLELTSCKPLFSGVPVYNRDLAAARIIAVMEEPANAKYYLYPYLWTMLGVSAIGTIFFFKSPGWFNLLTGVLIVYFYMQHASLTLKVASRLEEMGLPPSCNTVYNELESEMWVPSKSKVSSSFFSKSVFDHLGIEYKGPYGNIGYEKKVDLSSEPILSRFKEKEEEDFLFYGTDGNLYEAFNSSNGPKFWRVTIGFSILFKALSREEDMGKNLIKAGFEAVTTSFVLYLSMTGFTLGG